MIPTTLVAAITCVILSDPFLANASTYVRQHDTPTHNPLCTTPGATRCVNQFRYQCNQAGVWQLDPCLSHQWCTMSTQRNVAYCLAKKETCGRGEYRCGEGEVWYCDPVHHTWSAFKCVHGAACVDDALHKTPHCERVEHI